MWERARDDKNEPSGQKVDFFKTVVHTRHVEFWCLDSCASDHLGSLSTMQIAGLTVSHPRSIYMLSFWLDKGIKEPSVRITTVCP